MKIQIFCWHCTAFYLCSRCMSIYVFICCAFARAFIYKLSFCGNAHMGPRPSRFSFIATTDYGLSWHHGASLFVEKPAPHRGPTLRARDHHMRQSLFIPKHGAKRHPSRFLKEPDCAFLYRVCAWRATLPVIESLPHYIICQTSPLIHAVYTYRAAHSELRAKSQAALDVLAGRYRAVENRPRWCLGVLYQTHMPSRAGAHM